MKRLKEYIQAGLLCLLFCTPVAILLYIWLRITLSH